MEKAVFLEQRKKIVENCEKAAGITTRDKKAQNELAETLRGIYRLGPEDLWGIIMSIRGQALRYHMSLNQIAVLSNTCWSLSEEATEEADKIFFSRLSTNLRTKTCGLFAAVLSGGEYAHRNQDGWKHYSFSRIPTRILLIRDVRFSISRANVKAIMSAYDQLIEEAGKEKNELATNHWEIQKRAFLFLLEHVSPKLL